MPDDNLRGRYRRDFTKETIGGSTPKPSSQPPAHQSAHTPAAPDLDLVPALADIKTPRPRHKRRLRKQRSLKKVFITLLILILVGGVAAIGYVYVNRQPTAQAVPAKVKQQASVPILYPGKLPPGYKVIQSSFNVSAGGIVAYYAEDSSGNRLNFTVQARPANFDFETFYTRILANATKFSTPLGEAAVGTANDHLLGSLATTKSWVIVSGNSKAVAADQIRIALSDMQVR